MPDLIIRNGSVVTAAGVAQTDIEIDDGYITRIASSALLGKHELDATGLTILPGLIDGHVHFNEPGRSEWEGAASGSRALAAGGGVAFVDMPLNSTPCTVDAANFAAKRQALEQSSITDFALWGGLVPGAIPHMAELAGCGVVGFKAFLSDSGLPEFPRADDLTLYEGLLEAARLGLPVAVHAESEEITAGLARRAIHEGRSGIRDYLASRPVIAEVEAIQRAALLASEAGGRLHIVHVSSGSGVAAALEARGKGVQITIETCPHYVFFTAEDLERIGAAAKCAPPLRSRAERDSLLLYLRSGHIDLIASDHSPAPASLKAGDDFFAIWGGIAGVQSTLAVLLTTASLPLPRIADLIAGYPARHFGFHAKGHIEPGHDADLVFVDLPAHATLGAEQLLQKHPISPYIGSQFKGRMVRTMLRGQTIFHDGQITATAAGRFLRPSLNLESFYA